MEKAEYVRLLQRARKLLPQEISESFRFEIPKINSFQEGSKTIVTNWQSITKKINRDEHLRKIIAKNLATSFFEKNKQIVLIGKFTKELLNRQLNDYISKYVICSECSRPDTNLIKKGRIWFMICEACGAQRAVKRI